MRQECVSLRNRPIRPWRSRSDNIRRQPAIWPKSIFRLTGAQRYMVIEYRGPAGTWPQVKNLAKIRWR